MRILVLGSTGMLGHMVLKVLQKNKEWEVKGMSSSEFDAAEFLEAQPLESRFQGLSLTPSVDYIVNCIGVLAGGDEGRMWKINAEFPHRLAKATEAKIIHMSTDGVFSGKNGPYDEASPPDATDIYGKSKLAGEVHAPNVINIRTSIIGPSPYKKKGLLEWFLAQPDGTTVKGYTNHIWNGVTTLQFGELCGKIIRTEAFDRLCKESSVFHFAPNEPVTKYELLLLFKKVWHKNVEVERAEDTRGPVERVMKTRYVGLKKLFSYDVSIEIALGQLEQYAEQTL